MNTPKYLPADWFHPSLTLRRSPIHGQGLFATESISAGEVVMIWGGVLYTESNLSAGKVPSGKWSYSMIDEGLFLFAPRDAWSYFVNHSCDPNVWMADEVTVVARHTIQPDEEICGDYAVWESKPTYNVDPCRCGSSLCRGRYTGDDWKRPELQARYHGHFLPYLNRRIAELV